MFKDVDSMTRRKVKTKVFRKPKRPSKLVRMVKHDAGKLAVMAKQGAQAYAAKAQKHYAAEARREKKKPKNMWGF